MVVFTIETAHMCGTIGQGHSPGVANLNYLAGHFGNAS
jgi:hypothetical protein